MMALLTRVLLLAAAAQAFVARPNVLAPLAARGPALQPQQFVAQRSRAAVALPSRCVAGAAEATAPPPARATPPPTPDAAAARAETSRWASSASDLRRSPSASASPPSSSGAPPAPAPPGPAPAPTAPPYAPRPRRPEKLTVMAKDFGKIAGELKDVPKEFKEGLDSVEPSSSKSLAAEKPAEEKTEA